MSNNQNIVPIVSIIILLCITIPAGLAGVHMNLSENSTPFVTLATGDADEFPSVSWREKLSSDLLQLLDPSACSPGRTPADMAREMEIFGQLRYGSDSRAEVPVIITLTDTGNGTRVIPYLNQTTTDPTYGLITGWIHTSAISDVATLPEVGQIRTLLPPAASGSVKMSTNEQISKSEYIKINNEMPNLSASNLFSESTSGGSDNRVFTPESSGIVREDMIWKEKLSTDLLQLLDDRYLSPGQSLSEAKALMTATGELRLTSVNTSEVMISAMIDTGSQSSRYVQFFSRYENDPRYGRIAGWLNVTNLSLLASEPGVISVMAQIPPITSRIITEGDALLHSDDLRNGTNLTGKGIKIGIISDGVSSLEDVIAEGELPADVHVLRNSIGGDEGTAMLQIVHDIAPDSELFFHDRGSSQIEFVQAMDTLISSGCQIICDDITYVEPFFEDGYIARNIRDRVLSYGILYVTSAGNFAQEHYQAPFNGYIDKGYAWHDFQGTGGSKDLKFTAPPHTAGHIILQWDDQFSESSNNYDLFVYNSEQREIGRSVKIQDGDDDPMEYCRFINDEDHVNNFSIQVVQAGGQNRTIEIYVLPMGGTQVTLDPCVPEDSMFGQQAVTEALSVGAVSPDTNFTIEPYSSRGPVTIKFPEPELRQKPELSAPDVITVSAGSNSLASFSGTSASAPHIAGLGCLLWSSNLDLKGSEVRSGLIDATSGRNLTWHPATGYGVPDARLLISRIQTLTNETRDTINQINYSRTFKPREMEPADAIVLYSGWNMISIPFPLEAGYNTGLIFSDINTTSHTIWRYESGISQWEPVRSDDLLSQMDVIWVHSVDRAVLSLTYDDSRQNMTSRHLNKGWNPLGIPGRNTVTACDLLTPLGNSWSYILVYDPRIQQYRPGIVNGGTGAYSDARLLYPTEGFWIYMNSPGIIIP